MRKPEIMSPAGYWPQLRAAIEAGADSIIVRDWAVVKMARRGNPGYPISLLFSAQSSWNRSEGGSIMVVKSRAKQSRSRDKRLRKAKFQADLAPADDRVVRVLKEELQLNSNTDFLSDVLALFRWAVSERKLGHRIVSETPGGERKILVLPRLERVAPEFTLPRVEIGWTARELESLAELASAPNANPPTGALIRAMRD